MGHHVVRSRVPVLVNHLKVDFHPVAEQREYKAAAGAINQPSSVAMNACADINRRIKL